MNEPEEDLSVSVPEGFAQPVIPQDDPLRPGVKLSELRRGPMGRPLGAKEPAWLMWLVIGLLVFILLPAALWMFGFWGLLILIGLGIVGLLIAIFIRLGRR